MSTQYIIVLWCTSWFCPWTYPFHPLYATSQSCHSERVDYCNSLLAGLPQCHLKKIQYVQNAAARLIFRAPKSDHVSSLLQKLHWLPISCRIEHKISSLCYNSLSGTGPQYLTDLNHMYTPTRCLCFSSDARIHSIPTVKTKSYGQRSFAYQGPTIWNKQLLEIRSGHN